MPLLREIPFVFMTAKVQRHEAAEYTRAGATGVIQKPFDLMMLAADLGKILARAK